MAVPSAFKGPPTSILRNWDAYAYYRDPASNQCLSRKHHARQATAFLQRARAGLLLPTELTRDLVEEDYTSRAAREQECIRMQGNTVLLPPAACTRVGGIAKQLVVHAGGPIMSELRLSWLCHGRSPPHPTAGQGEEEEHDDEEDPPPSSSRGRGRSSRKRKWWMAGTGRAIRCETGRLRQLELLPPHASDDEWWGDDDDGGGVVETWAFARAGYQAVLFAVTPTHEWGGHDDDGEQQVGGMGVDDVGDQRPPPYLIRMRQKLKFKSRLVSIAGRSTQRAALLSEDLRLYEWDAAVGATPCHIDLQQQQGGDGSSSGTHRWWSYSPQVSWGCHPRSLWVSVASKLLHVDLRDKALAATYDHLLLPYGGVGLGRQEGGGQHIGCLGRHPCRENVLFASAESALLAFDVRCLRGPLEVLPQAETSTMLHTAIIMGAAPTTTTTDAVMASAGQQTARLHVHVREEEEESCGGRRNITPAQAKRVLEAWQSDTWWLAGKEQEPFPSYRTLTCFNADQRTQRSQPVWLAGFGIAHFPPPSQSRGGAAAALTYMSSLGDIYLQELLINSNNQNRDDHDDNDDQEEDDDLLTAAEPPLATTAASCHHHHHLLCGLTTHYQDEEGDGPPAAAAALPSHAFLQPHDASSLRRHQLVPIDPQHLPSLLPQHPPNHLSSSLSSSSSVVRESLLAFLADEPRTLAQIRSYLHLLTAEQQDRQQQQTGSSSRSSSSSSSGGGGGGGSVGSTAAELHEWLVSQHRRGAMISSARCSLPAKPYMPRQSDVHVIVDQQKDEGSRKSSKSAASCRCMLSGHANNDSGRQREEAAMDDQPSPSPPPCDAPACLVPHACVYWSSPEALLVRRARRQQQQGVAGGSRHSGLERETIDWLRERWQDEEEEEAS